MITSHVLEHDENQILLGARLVREHYYPKQKNALPDWVLILAIRDLLTTQPGISPEELSDLLINRSEIKLQAHLSRYLAATVVSEATGDAAGAGAFWPSVFTGGRRFSFEKLSAMAAYITFRGHEICETKLNKLLFYSDFVNYYLYGFSISGAKYIRHRFGPMLDQFESIFKTLEYTGAVRIKTGLGSEKLLVASDDLITENLTVLETVSLYWVLANFGSMTASEIREVSTLETAHRYTLQFEHIPYEYARLLKRLPIRSDL